MIFALVHGAWHGAWAWERLAPELEARGHRVVAVDLPAEDPAAGASACAAVVVDALRDAGDDVVLVGHSLGGLTVPLVAAARPVRRLVLLCALLPAPGRSLADQLSAGDDPFALGAGEGRARDELGRSRWVDASAATRILYGECDPALAAAAFARLRPQSPAVGEEPCPLTAWPQVPTEYVLATGDAIVAPDWSRRAAPARLGVVPRELAGDHSPMLSRPTELAELLIRLTAVT